MLKKLLEQEETPNITACACGSFDNSHRSTKIEIWSGPLFFYTPKRVPHFGHGTWGGSTSTFYPFACRARPTSRWMSCSKALWSQTWDCHGFAIGIPGNPKFNVASLPLKSYWNWPNRKPDRRNQPAIFQGRLLLNFGGKLDDLRAADGSEIWFLYSQFLKIDERLIAKILGVSSHQLVRLISSINPLVYTSPQKKRNWEQKHHNLSDSKELCTIPNFWNAILREAPGLGGSHKTVSRCAPGF